MIRVPTGEKQGETTNGLIKRLPSKQDGTARKGSCKKGSFFVINILFIAFRLHSLLATDNLSLPASDNYLDTRLEFFPSEKPSNSSLRSVA